MSDNRPISTTEPVDPAFQAAVQRAYDEFSTLTLGKEEMDMAETVELREYVKRRTDLSKPDEQLTNDQRAWKLLYESLDEQLEKNLGKETKQNIDKAKTQLDEINLVQKNVDLFSSLGKEIEKKFTLQKAILIFHFQKEENTYREAEEKLSSAMVSDETEKSKRIEYANNILDLAKVYKEKVVQPLFENQEELHRLLTEFDNLYKQTPFETAGEDENIQKLKQTIHNWLTLSWELYQERVKAITAVKNHVEADEFLPQHIIKNDGDNKQNISSEEFGRKIAAVHVLTKAAHEKEQEIDKKREPLSENLFGKPETYMDFGNNQTSTADQTSRVESKPAHPLQDKMWFRFLKVVYIGAYALILLVPVYTLLDGGDEDSFWAILIIIAIFTMIKKGFYYVVLGKTDWKK